jgi:hypothetical protein
LKELFSFFSFLLINPLQTLVRAEAEWAGSITTPRPLAAKSFGSEDAKETQTTLTTKKNASKLA